MSSRRRAEFHGQQRFGDHLAGFGADDVHAEHAVGLGVGQDFTKPSVAAMVLARALAVKGNLPTL